MRSEAGRFLETLFAGKPDDLYIVALDLTEKQSRWFRNIQGAIQFAESSPEDGGDEADLVGTARMYVERYLSETPFIDTEEARQVIQFSPKSRPSTSPTTPSARSMSRTFFPLIRAKNPFPAC